MSIQTSKRIGQLPRPLGDMPAVARDNAAFVFGGGSGQEMRDEILKIDFDGQVEQVGQLPLPLRGHQAVAVDDSVFLLGGFADGTRADVWRLNMRDWTAKPVQPMPRESAWFSVTVVGRRIYVVGGFAIPQGYWTDMAVYDIDGDRWETSSTSFPKELFPRGCLGSNAALGLEGRLLTFGGADQFDPVRTRANALDICAEYRLDDKQWRPLVGRIEAREGLVAAQEGSSAFLVGGMPESSEAPLALVERVDLETGKVTQFGTLSSGVTVPAVAIVNKRLLIIGGVTQPPFEMTDRIEAFDIG